MRVHVCVAFLAMCALATVTGAAPPTPDSVYNRMAGALKADTTGELFCWRVNAGMGVFLQNYQSSGDTAWLDAGVKFYDGLIAKMTPGPDGYKGFVGPYGGKGEFSRDYWADTHVGDAILFDHILEFAHVVTSDPKLLAKYGAKAKEYVEIAKKDEIEKWDARGTWHDMGLFGTYSTWTKYAWPDDHKNWAPMGPEDKAKETAPLTLPFNKDMKMAMLALRISQVTGEEKYRHRAQLIFARFKSRILQWNDSYHWNYWEPGGPWDLSGDPEHPFKHWINTHGHRNYQESEVNDIVSAYNAGLVFTEADIKAILRTNLKVMWNQDLQNPLWATSTAALRQILDKPDTYHKFQYNTYGAKVWPALGQFDPTIRTLANDTKTTRPPTFDRLDMIGKLDIPEFYNQFPLGSARTLRMVTVLPQTFASGEEAVVTCKLGEPDDLEVALYSKDGKDKLATLFHDQAKGGEDGRDGLQILRFAGKDPASGKALPAGDYRIRWTVTGDGYRGCPITITAAGAALPTKRD